MSEIDLQSHDSVASSTNPARANFLWQQLPYILALVLAIAGVAYTNISHRPLVGYWEFLSLAIAAVCVVAKWPQLDNKQAQFRLLWTQALHWVAVLVAMNIVLISSVQQLLPTPASSLVLLVLLALGTFLAGLSLLLPQICFLGVAMAATVPALSWLKQSMIFFLLAAVLLVGLGMTFWLYRGDQRVPVSPQTNDQHES
ncbi:hypothetical protein ACQR1W_38690 [Bradyrhizobium sp. HKCCYLS1011]|uniref:hypothetical protein n=1 Tax=Bradyrhizobium sp. HKCCYLS1011 TaxID=3420733 RepID=UPI003EBA3078